MLGVGFNRISEGVPKNFGLYALVFMLGQARLSY